jgi:hypothetical protein
MDAERTQDTKSATGRMVEDYGSIPGRVKSYHILREDQTRYVENQSLFSIASSG